MRPEPTFTGFKSSLVRWPGRELQGVRHRIHLTPRLRADRIRSNPKYHKPPAINEYNPTVILSAALTVPESFPSHGSSLSKDAPARGIPAIVWNNVSIL